jgi:hypothetical protein
MHRQLKRLVVAAGPHATGSPATGPTLIVASGDLPENDLAACVRALLGEGGGSLSATTANGRTLYTAQDSGHTMYFAYGRPDTVVLGPDLPYLNEALGSGAKISDDKDTRKWLALVDQKAPVVAAGRLDGRIGAGLVRITDKQVHAGPTAFAVAFDPTSGAKLEAAVVMVDAADAKALESWANTQIGVFGMAAQAKGLMKAVGKLKIAADGTVVRFHADLDVDDLNQLVSALDGGARPAQDSPPAGSAVSAK